MIVSIATVRRASAGAGRVEGTMTGFTPAEDTVMRLHDATRAGVPVMIPGALETPVSGPSQRQPVDLVAVAVASRVALRVADDRGRLENEREGGGAPGQRRPPSGFLLRLAHCLLHPADLPKMWRHAVQER